MPFRFRSVAAWPLAVVAMAAFVVASVPSALEAQANPFAQLAGSWRGSGTISPLGAQKERVSCRVTYNLSGNQIVQQLDCAGTDFRIAVRSDLTVTDESISGRWQETNYGFGGTASGLARGDRIFVRVTGEKFNGRMSITVGGSQHTVHISQFDPGSGRYAHMASLTMTRR